MKQGLDIPSISEVYIDAHNTSHARTRLHGDMIIYHVIDHTLHMHLYMQCTTTEAEKVYRDTLEGDIPILLGDNSKQLKYRYDKEVRGKIQDSGFRRST